MNKIVRTIRDKEINKGKRLKQKIKKNRRDNGKRL